MQDIEIEDNGNYHAKFKNVPNEKIKYIENNAYIKTSMKNAILGFSSLKGSKNEYKPYLMIMAYDNQMFKNMPLHLLEGRIPQNSHELLISSHIESNGGIKYKVGDTITLDIGKRYLGSELIDQDSAYIKSDEMIEKLNVKTTNSYKIVGLIDRPTFESYSSPGYTVITYMDSKTLSLIDNVNIFVITKNPTGIYDKLESIAREVNLPLKEEGDSKFYDIEYHNALLRWYGVTNNDNANMMLYGFALILIVIIMIASIIVIYNSFNISITERKKQFGMLASIGTTSKQIRNMVLKEGLLIGSIGIPLGIIGSIIGIGITLNVINSLGVFNGVFESRLSLAISPFSIMVTIFFSSLTILLSSLIPAYKASKTSPIDAIRLSDDIKIKVKN
jgi:putative ABC transport system permease protein